jgi:hypothetical protein
MNQKEERKTVVGRSGTLSKDGTMRVHSFLQKRCAHACVFGTSVQREVCANISTKMLIHIRIFGIFNAKKPESMLCLQKKWSKKPSRPKRAEGG